MSNKALADRMLAAQEALQRAYPDVGALLWVRDMQKDFRFLRIVQDGERAWRGVMGTWSPDGTPMVTYSVGGDYMDVLHGLCVAYSNGKTYPDRFANGVRKPSDKG